MARIYLDANATTPLDPRVRAVIAEAEQAWGNPSSVHAEGRRARALVEDARREVEALIGAPGTVVFTSGGTEAAQLAIVGAARAAHAAGRPARVVSSPLEHPCVLAALEALEADGWEVERVAPRLADLASALEGEAALVSFATANAELGVITDIPALAAAAHDARALLHTDAAQAAGKLPLADRVRGADLVTISAHKIHGPRGAGAVWARTGVELRPAFAGHQERGLRGGTENVAAIAGLGAAARLARAEAADSAALARIAALRDRLERRAVALGARVHGGDAPRVGNTTNVGWEGVPGELLVQALDLEGFAASTGSACTSGTVRPSHVLLALGLPPERAREAVRFSLDRATTAEDVDQLLAVLPRLLARIRAALA